MPKKVKPNILPTDDGLKLFYAVTGAASQIVEIAGKLNGYAEFNFDPQRISSREIATAQDLSLSLADRVFDLVNALRGAVGILEKQEGKS